MATRAPRACYAGRMKSFLDAYWRALAYCLLPRVIWMSLLPLVACVGVTGLVTYFFWEPGVAFAHVLIDHLQITQALRRLLDMVGLSGLHGVIAPLVLVVTVVPVIVILCLLTVAQIMVPAMVKLIRARRFPDLQTRGDEGWLRAMLRSVGWTVLAAVVLLVSLPLWLIPPLSAVIPPVIWGWLSYRVMTGDVLSGVATKDERATIFKTHRGPLWAIGLITGYLGAAPALLWAFGAVSLMFAPIIIIASVWLYTVVFVFSALWFAHYALAALLALRLQSGIGVAPAGVIHLPDQQPHQELSP